MGFNSGFKGLTQRIILRYLISLFQQGFAATLALFRHFRVDFCVRLEQDASPSFMWYRNFHVDSRSHP